MKVIKFGGSSLKPFDSFVRCCEITASNFQSTRGVVVVSAIGGVTNRLQALFDKALTCDDLEPDYREIQSIHLQRIDDLVARFPLYDFSRCSQDCLTYLKQLANWLKGTQLVQEANEKIQAKIISCGEQLSSSLFFHTLCALLAEKNNSELNAEKVALIDSTEYIHAEGNVLEAQYDEEICDPKIHALHQRSEHWFVAQGFVASSSSGQLVLLGRNGSDLSAAIYAAGLKADELEIWTDVDGVYTVDPNRITQAKVIDQLSYNEAMELSFFGAKVLHPKTIAPIASHKIPTRIKNTYAPESIGTLIHQQGGKGKDAIAGITMLENLAMINISGVNLKGKAGLAERVFHCVSSEKISIILISQSSSEYSISFCVEETVVSQAEKALNREFALEIKHQQIDPLNVKRDLASITVVGDRMKHARGTAAKLFSALAAANVNIVAIAQDSSERSISAVIRQQKADIALRKTYEYFFECPRVISVILYGVGIVGQELLNQIKQQQKELLELRIDLRVIAIANSKAQLFDAKGIDLCDWQTKLAQSEFASDLATLKIHIENNRPLNPVFVDCTSSSTLAGHYLNLFEIGCHIVAANKKANTETTDYYQKLRQSAQKHLRQFGYETNVGAGLPIIRHIQNQVRSGDRLFSFGGILSGSLSFIMGKLEDGQLFSKAVLEAKHKGYTEPDPREDLSGLDVARKLLIIAREFGGQFELKDVTIEPLLAPELSQLDSIEAFIEKLPEMDQSIEALCQSTRQNNQVLRYVGLIDEQGQMSVKVMALDRQHPLSAIRDGENAFSFTTKRYHPVPIVIRGYGAGAEVTAAGVFGDILQTVVA